MKTPTSFNAIVIVAILMLSGAFSASAQVPALSDCHVAEKLYTALNEPLLVRSQHGVQPSVADETNGVKDITAFVSQVILARLTDASSPGMIKSYLECMQEREGERPWPDITNAPYISINEGAQDTLAFSSFLVMRGGIAIPRTRALVECFVKQPASWRYVGHLQDQDSFDGHTFFINQLRSPVLEEVWYLLSGRTIGDTGGRLTLKVVSCSKKGLLTVWHREGIVWGEVSTDSDQVTLTYYKQGGPNTPLEEGQGIGIGSLVVDKQSGERLRFSEALRVRKKGLEQ